MADTFKIMLREGFDPDLDGVVDQAEAIVFIATAGVGGIRAYQVVYVANDGTVLPADNEDTSHAGRVKGLAVAAINAGADGLIQTSGEVINDDWDLEPGTIYYVGRGEITALEPARGFSQVVGIAKDSVTLILALSEPIILV